MTEQVHVTQDIDAPPEVVWAMISDVTRMGEWSPENEGAVWGKGVTGPVPGAKFKGTNRNGSKTWSTDAHVVDAEPGRRFSFRVTALGLKVALWSYDIEPTDTGCRVTETWTDERGRIAAVFGGPVSGVKDRVAHNRAGMEQTLQGLKAAAESAAATA